MKQFGNLTIRKLFYLSYLVIIGQWLSSLGKILLSGVLFDFGYFLRAVGHIFSGVNPYFAENFVYPPPVLFLFVPFYFLPLFWSQLIWTLFSVGCLVFSIYFSLKILKIKPKKNLLFLIGAILLSFPIRWTFGLGQINFLVLLMIVLTYFWAEKKKDLWSGICLGLAVVLKMTPLFLVFYFLIKKRFKIVAVVLATLGILLVFSGLAFGFGLTRDYVTLVIPRLFEPTSKFVYYNQAFSGFSSRILSSADTLLILNLVFTLVIGISAVFLFLKTKTINVIDYSLAICSMLLINGFSWQHHFSFLIFPFLTFLKASPCWSKGTPCKSVIFRYSLLIISYLLVSFNISQPELLGNSFFAKMALSHVFFGTLLLWFLLLFLIRNEKVFY